MKLMTWKGLYLMYLNETKFESRLKL